jgi:NAD(P)-dependent dehydrogenase (short-subunit alcohol dehydrogenase family)
MSERTVLITGATGAVGAAMVDVMLEAGWHVVATWVVPEERERMQEPEGLELVQADLLQESDVSDAVTRAAFGPGGLRAVVNLVGGYAAGAPLHETALEDFEKLFRLNLRPTFLVTRAAVPFMLDAGGGSIVCVSARAAVQPFGGAVGYVSSKAAVLAFAQAVAADYRDRGVRCNAVLPSVVDTPANRKAQPDADHSRWVAPVEIARVIRFLCSDESAPVSGAAIPVYGRA